MKRIFNMVINTIRYTSLLTLRQFISALIQQKQDITIVAKTEDRVKQLRRHLRLWHQGGIIRGFALRSPARIGLGHATLARQMKKVLSVKRWVIVDSAPSNFDKLLPNPEGNVLFINRSRTNRISIVTISASGIKGGELPLPPVYLWR
jgi:hypothetical protein